MYITIAKEPKTALNRWLAGVDTCSWPLLVATNLVSVSTLLMCIWMATRPLLPTPFAVVMLAMGVLSVTTSGATLVAVPFAKRALAQGRLVRVSRATLTLLLFYMQAVGKGHQFALLRGWAVKNEPELLVSLSEKIRLFDSPNSYGLASYAMEDACRLIEKFQNRS